MITIILEGDEAGIISLLEGHLLAFFNQGGVIHEPAEYVRLVMDGDAPKILADETVRISSVQTAGVLYRSDMYMTDETPYTALWRSLKELLPPRLYEMLKIEFKLKNAAFSRAKYNAAKKDLKGAKQERMF